MVRRTGADAVTAGAGAPARRAAAGRAAAAPAERPATRWEHRLLAGFFVTLVIPGSFSVAGLTLSPSRLFLLLAFVPLFLHWFRGRAWRITAGDVGILLYCFWIWVALFAVHGLGRVHSAGIQFVEMFGGYLVGRTLVRSAEDYRTFVRYLFWAMAFLFPFALAEFLTGWSPLSARSRRPSSPSRSARSTSSPGSASSSGCRGPSPTRSCSGCSARSGWRTSSSSSARRSSNARRGSGWRW